MKQTVALILTLLFSVTLLQGQNIPRLYKKCIPSIVKLSVQHYDGTASEGTGFFIGERAIVTCYHILDNVNTVQIETSTGKQFTVDSIISSNRNTDLIKFTVKERNESWLTLADKLPTVGESVFIIGNPDDYDFSISSGIVSALRMKNSVQVIQNTAPCSPGNSGSPVLNAKGKVIGVMSFVKYAGQNLNFAANSLDVINMTNDNTIKGLKPAILAISGYEIETAVKQSKYYFSKGDYKNALNTIIPVTKFVDSTQSIEVIKLIADCHFFLQDYSKAAQYYEVLIKTIYAFKRDHSPEDVVTLAQALNSSSIC